MQALVLTSPFRRVNLPADECLQVRRALGARQAESKTTFATRARFYLGFQDVGLQGI